MSDPTAHGWTTRPCPGFDGFVAVLRNLAVIGEAVRALPDEVKNRLFVLTIDVPGTSGAPWDAHASQLPAVRTDRRLVLTWRDDPT